jgi:hypothetical protein
MVPNAVAAIVQLCNADQWFDYLILFPTPNNEFFCCDGWGRRLVSGMVTSVI